jgi:hypothetical protein
MADDPYDVVRGFRAAMERKRCGASSEACRSSKPAVLTNAVAEATEWWNK